MTLPVDSQQFESFVPVYDAFPDKWEAARGVLTEHLKKMSNAINIREIGWLLDEELLSGKAFFPAPVIPGTGNPPQFRQILRKVVDLGPLVIGANPGVPHGILFDNKFTLIDLWVAGTNSGTLAARDINGNDVLMDATNIVVTSPAVFDRAICVIEYIQEI